MVHDAEATQQILLDRVKAYWDETKGDPYRSVLPTGFSITANNCAVIGALAGASHGFTEQIANGLNLAAKEANMPFFKDVKPMEQSRHQIFGRIFLSSMRGTVVGSLFGATFLLLQCNPSSSFANPKNSMLISGICAGTVCGALCKF